MRGSKAVDEKTLAAIDEFLTNDVAPLAQSTRLVNSGGGVLNTVVPCAVRQLKLAAQRARPGSGEAAKRSWIICDRLLGLTFLLQGECATQAAQSCSSMLDAEDPDVRAVAALLCGSEIFDREGIASRVEKAFSSDPDVLVRFGAAIALHYFDHADPRTRAAADMLLLSYADEVGISTDPKELLHPDAWLQPIMFSLVQAVGQREF